MEEVYIVVKYDGQIKGAENIDKAMLEINNIIRDHIFLSTIGLFEIIEVEDQNNT